MQNPNSQLDIRLARMDDLPALVDIYNQAIRSRSATGDMDEFTVEGRLDWFHKHMPNEHPIFVSLLNQQVVGFSNLSPYRPGRRAMTQVAEVSFFVDYHFHKQGIGSALLQHSIDQGRELGIKHLLAILLDINHGSIALLRKFGFELWGEFRGIIHFEKTTCNHLYYGKHI